MIDKMSEKEKLKFSVHVERKITTKPYESAVVGFWKEFYQDDVSVDYAFEEVKSLVEVAVKEMRV